MINVPKLRKRLGFHTQASFAEYVGVDQATVSRWEQGKAEPSGPALVLLKMLAKEPDRHQLKRTQAAE